MKIFYTPSTSHLQTSINLPIGSVEFKTFSDGELFVKVNEEVNNQSVWVIAATNPPAKNLLQTMLLLNALQEAGAKINLLFTYFGYARQDKVSHGEAASAQLFCELFGSFNLESVEIIHVHSLQLKNYLNFENIIAYPLFEHIGKNFDAICAPDKGAASFATNVAKKIDKSEILIEKTRPKKETVKTANISGDTDGKSVLIVDDMISTGNTIINAANLLREHGATSISVMATHNLMNQKSVDAIEQSVIEKVYVTNTIQSAVESDKIEVIDIGQFIEKRVKEESTP